MNVHEIAGDAGIELANTLRNIDEQEIIELMDAIVGAKKIFVSGAGRSLLMLRCLAMRLMHLGFESYVVGDTITPAFEANDLLITASGSGETSGVVNVAKKAKKLGGKVAAITINPDSTLGQLADVVIQVAGYTDKVEMADAKRPVLPGGSLFEQSVLVLGDAMVVPLSEKANIPTDRAFTRHANLE